MSLLPLAQAESKLADLRQGKRREEIDMIVASINSARAQAEEAQRALAGLAESMRAFSLEQIEAYEAALWGELTPLRIEPQLQRRIGGAG